MLDHYASHALKLLHMKFLRFHFKWQTALDFVELSMTNVWRKWFVGLLHTLSSSWIINQLHYSKVKNKGLNIFTLGVTNTKRHSGIFFEEIVNKLKFVCKIWGFHGGDYDDYHLLGDDAVWLLSEPTFRRIVSPPSSGCKYKQAQSEW
jgi:hypothetical protein